MLNLGCQRCEVNEALSVGGNYPGSTVRSYLGANGIPSACDSASGAVIRPGESPADFEARIGQCLAQLEVYQPDGGGGVSAEWDATAQYGVRSLIDSIFGKRTRITGTEAAPATPGWVMPAVIGGGILAVVLISRRRRKRGG